MTQAISSATSGPPHTMPKSSETFPELPDALAKALASIVADHKRDSQRELDRLNAESRATIAELKNEIAELKRELREASEQSAARVEEAIANVRDGIDGKDGQDGRDGIDGKEGTPGKDGEPGKPGEKGESGRDGNDGLAVVDFLRGDNGHLIVTLSDGSTKDLGEFVGKDGTPGKDGRDGVDGKDGLGAEDMSFEYDGERTLTVKFAKGEKVRDYTFTLPIVIDRGTYQSGGQYAKGDGVTCRGCFWIAQKDLPEGAPGNGSSEWRLAVKAGRDGKSGDRGEKGEKGDPGRPGKDLTQLGHDGTKW